MKRFLHYLSATLLLLLSACTNDGIEAGENGLWLELSVPDMSLATRTIGVDALNENKVETIDVFMFEAGEETAAVYRHLNVSELQQFIRLSDDELTSLGDAAFDIIVVANLPVGSAVTSQRSRTEIEAIGLSADFSQRPQSSFVMKGTCTSVKTGDDYTATVELRRLAAKFSVAVTFAASLEGDLDSQSGPWTADPSGVTVKMYNCQTNGKLSGVPVTPASEINYTAEDISLSNAYFYSYPRHVRMEQRPYFVMKVPVNNGSVTRDCYYKFILDRDDYTPNTLYKLTANIHLVGGADEPNAQTLTEGEFSYVVADWKAVSAYESEIKDARYLMTYADSYVMENVNDIDIPFTSSHECVVEVTSATYLDYSTTNPSSKNASGHTATIPAGKQIVHLSHTLDNDWLSTNQNYHVAPFEYTIRIKHKDKPTEYYHDILVTQNPAIVITNEYNGYSNGYEYVNGSRSATNLGGSSAVGGQTQNMYIIRVSALPEGSDFIIGDPRDFSDTRWKYTGTPALTSAPDIKTGTNRNTLDNYYPTREDGTADNVIAPVIRTSSAWGRLGGYGNTRETVKKRAATYQEGGYPAGRWRLLTQAEAKILAKLNHDNKIPDLFSDGNRFLVAGGYILGQTVTADATQNGSVRLCYDEWYWSLNEKYATCKPLDRFTWGDMPRNNFE